MSTTRHDHQEGTGRMYSPNVPVDALLTRGVAAGLVGGLASSWCTCSRRKAPASRR